MELMKERFAKLLLGEDMSGGGKGVSSTLALSNAITNLAASVFGEQWCLEPMSAERKARWRKEVDWLLSIMVTRQRADLLMNNPALRKLDGMLIFQKESVRQVLKAAMAINGEVLAEMQNGRASLGDSIYRSITVEFFDPKQFLSTLYLSTEHKILEMKNRIEASIVIWKRKTYNKDAKSSWGSAVSIEKREQFEE
ncbi:hypothetical protein MRB53_006516 [Persea americana]|uniref:Uncharacterized protein n=1 Tax=Persea americana TaxID=3435 RepID=A0ACC2MGM8_PERAE|nr:hypothetical protein MRB53_006516 [Persea americana]